MPSSPAAGLREAALELIDSVLLARKRAGSPPEDLRGLLRLCVQRLDEEAAAALKASEERRRLLEQEGKAAAAADRAAAGRGGVKVSRSAAEQPDAARSEAADALAAAERLKAEASAKVKAEERAIKEAAQAAKAAAAAQRAAEEVVNRGDSAGGEGPTAPTGNRRAAQAEAEAAERRLRAEQKADDATARQAAKAEKALRKAERKRRKAEEKALADAERLAERARERAGLAMDVALAAEERLVELGGTAPKGEGKAPAAADSSSAAAMASRRLSRGQSRLSALTKGSWGGGRGAAGGQGGGMSSGGSSESDTSDTDEEGGAKAKSKSKPKRGAGGAFTVTYGDEEEYNESGTASEAMAASYSSGQGRAKGSAGEDASASARGHDPDGAEAEADTEAEFRRAEREARRARQAAGEDDDEDDDGGGGERPLPKWLQPWRELGGERCAEMDGVMTVQSDCCAGEGRDLIVCVGGDGDSSSVSLYSVKLGHVVKSLRGHTDKVHAVACQGDLIASGSKDRTIRLWSRRTGERTATLIGCDEAVHGLSLREGWLMSGEGGRAESGGGRVRLWELRTGRVHTIFTEHRGGVWSVALGDVMAVSASHDATCRVWPTDGSEDSLAVLHHPSWVCSCAMDGGFGLVATGCADTRVRLWSLRGNFACTRVIEHGGGGAGGTSPVFSVRLMRGGHVLLSGGQDGKIKLWALRGDLHSASEAGEGAGSASERGVHQDKEEGAEGGEPSLSASAECIATLAHGEHAVRGIAMMGRELSAIVSAGGRSAAGVVVWRPAVPTAEAASPDPKRSTGTGWLSRKSRHSA